jgi:LysR family transcriptional regulator of beta-lactamase
VALLPTLSDAFARMETALEQIRENRPREVLTVGVVGTFAVGWLLPRLRHFSRPTRLWTCACLPTTTGWTWPERAGLCHPLWRRRRHGTHAQQIFQAPLSPMCTPALAQGCSSRVTWQAALLRSYRTDEWTAWFAAAGLPCPVLRGAVFDSSLTLAEAAAQGAGVALLPVALFTRELQQGRLVQPFALELHRGAYWLTHLQSRTPTAAMQAFGQWLLEQTH